MFDLAWPRWRVALDYQGGGHRTASQYARDVRRIDEARHVGWDLLQITKSDLFDHPFDLLGRLRARLAERGAPVRVVPASKVSLAKP
jgi:very-short-patch-repair endonuclease